MNNRFTQQEQLVAYLSEHGLARASELNAAGIAATTVSRAVAEGAVMRVGRGLYQLADTAVDSAQSLAEASKRVPKGVVCLISALAFHELTDQMPRRVWIAIGAKAWTPKVDYPRLRIVRFRPPNLEYGVEQHNVSGVSVPIYSVTKSLADAFRNPKLVDRSVAIECLRNAVQQNKASPADIAQTATACGAWRRMQPYLETLTSYG